jgi:hypothetical protein
VTIEGVLVPYVQVPGELATGGSPRVRDRCWNLLPGQGFARLAFSSHSHSCHFFSSRLAWSSISFNAPRNYLVEPYSDSVVIADFNVGGRPDIAADLPGQIESLGALDSEDRHHIATCSGFFFPGHELLTTRVSRQKKEWPWISGGELQFTFDREIVVGHLLGQRVA